MSSKATQIIAPTVQDPNQDAVVWVDGPTNSLLVKVVNPGGGGGGGTEFFEDTPHASGDAGNMPLAVRKDAAGSLVSTDGDYAPLQVDASGALRVVVTGGGSGGTEFAEDSPHASGALGNLPLAVRNDTPGALAGTDLDYAPLQVDATGRLRVAVDASVALSVAVSNFPATQAVTQSTSPWVVGDGGGSLTVDGTVAVSSVIPGTGLTNLGKATGGAFSFVGDVGVAMLTVDTGTLTWQPLLSTGNILLVGGNVGVTALTPGTAAANLGKAEDGVHASGDVGVMALAVRNDALTAMAANGDYHALMVNGSGRLVTAVPDGLVVNNVFSGGEPSSLGKVSDTTFASADVGVMALALRVGDAVYRPLLLDNSDQLLCSTVVEFVIPGTTATALGKAEDAAHTSGDVGVLQLAVRQDTLASSTSADNDYAALKVDSLGALYVNMGNPTSLADGQLASSLGVLFTSTGRTRVESIDIFNTSSSLTETVRVHLQQSGGTSRQVRQYTLGPGESVSVIAGDVWNLENGDEIEGFTTTATTVNYFITGVVR